MNDELHYHPTADQLALADAIDHALDDLLPLSRLHVAAEESEAVWAGLQELGIFSLTLGEAEGGSGLGAVEEALIATSLGRRLASPAVFATIGAAHAKPATGGRKTCAAVRQGGRLVVVREAGAQLVLLREAGAAALHAADATLAPLEDRLWLADLRQASALPEAVAHFDAPALLRLRLIDAAALAGIAEAALQMAVAYAGLREQFGRPIGTFQAVKHHCANMAIAARAARDQTNFAAVALDDGREDAALQVESALLVAGEAALGNAGKNIQIHGGIGFSDEADPHLLVKRAQLLVSIAGGLEDTADRIASVPSAVA